MLMSNSADCRACPPSCHAGVGVPARWGRFGLLVAAAWARVCAGAGSLSGGSGLVAGGAGAGWCRGLGVVGVVVAVLASVLVVPAGAVSAPVGGPGAPGNLSAVSVAEGVLLSWDAPEPASDGGGVVSGYRVLRRRPEQGERSLSVLVSDTGSAQTSYLDVSAAVGGELFVYRVVALSGGVAGARSGPARVRYAAPEPEPEPVVRAVEPEPEPVPDPVPEPEPEPEPVPDPVPA